MDEWALLAPYDVPMPSTDFDTNFRTVEGLPDLGGVAFRREGEPRLAAVRLAPPKQGPHISHHRRKEESGKAKKEGANTAPTGLRRGGRGKSCWQYEEFRAATNIPTVYKGQYKDSRGRSSSRRPNETKEKYP